MSKKVFIIDAAKCNGCNPCQIVSKDEHVANDRTPIAKPQPDTEQFWLKLTEKVRGTVPTVKVAYRPHLCKHCDKAHCMETCPIEGAIYKRDKTEGEEVFHGGIPSQYDALQRLFDHFKDCKIKVAYEAGPCGLWLYDKLTEDGIEAIVVPPSLIPIASGNKIKTDKRDSRKLGKLLKNNMLKRVYVLNEEDRVDRELLRTRRQIVEHRNDVARQIKSKLLFYGIQLNVNLLPS